MTESNKSNNSGNGDSEPLDTNNSRNTEMFSFKPYDNDHQSLQIGDLIFENQTDKVIVYGDIDITKSQQGLNQALKLQKMFDLIVEQLQASKDSKEWVENGDNLGATSTEHQSSKKVDNPFS